jgi:hypothetical protein
LSGPGGLARREVPGPGQGRLLHRRRQTGLFFCAFLTNDRFRLAGAVALLDGRIEDVHIDVRSVAYAETKVPKPVREAYDRLIAKWLAAGRTLTARPNGDKASTQRKRTHPGVSPSAGSISASD